MTVVLKALISTLQALLLLTEELRATHTETDPHTGPLLGI